MTWRSDSRANCASPLIYRDKRPSLPLTGIYLTMTWWLTSLISILCSLKLDLGLLRTKSRSFRKVHLLSVKTLRWFPNPPTSLQLLAHRPVETAAHWLCIASGFVPPGAQSHWHSVAVCQKKWPTKRGVDVFRRSLDDLTGTAEVLCKTPVWMGSSSMNLTKTYKNCIVLAVQSMEAFQLWQLDQPKGMAQKDQKNMGKRKTHEKKRLERLCCWLIFPIPRNWTNTL